MKPETAAELNKMMRKVVEEGTGRAANVGDLRMAGKTGTAEVRGGNQAWFIGFAPYDNPKYAVAVTIELTQLFGGRSQLRSPLTCCSICFEINDWKRMWQGADALRQ